MFYSEKKTPRIFATSPEDQKQTQSRLQELIQRQEVPESSRRGQKTRGWSPESIPQVGQKLGFLKQPAKPLVYSVFVTKGGVLKTSLTLNLARQAALHNIKTAIIGLDLQGDMTTALGHDNQAQSFREALARLNETKGLFDFFTGHTALENLLVPTDLPTLYAIPETPELAALDQQLIQKTNREQWLNKKVIERLKEDFDLIVMDCSPNWNQLITNALTSSDVVVSPLECKINNYRNYKMFQYFMDEFRDELELQFDHYYVPTRLSKSRRLSREIRDWYLDNIQGCTPVAVRDHIQGEEATAMHLSVAEYAPGTKAAFEMNQVVQNVGLPTTQKQHPQQGEHIYGART